MQNRKLSRRDFLKLGALSLGALGSLAFRPLDVWGDADPGARLGRVALYPSVSVYSQPNDKSTIVAQRYRDELLNLYYEVRPETGPDYNPLWYRVWQGYVHSAHIEEVKVNLNQPLESVPEKGQLVEVTVPYTQSLRYSRYQGWMEFYRLYYGSLHWVVGIDEGPDGEPWYRVKDELLEIEYQVPAIHMRPVLPEEFSPLSPDVPPEDKRIEVSLGRQMMTAYENDKIVFQTKVSSGMKTPDLPKDETPTETPKGSFRVYSKMPSKHMGDGLLNTGLDAYELPGVPWVTFFEQTGVAFHGTYWHQNFGVPMSHGCLNMKTEEARWVYRWTTPEATFDQWERRGNGTRIIVS